MMFALFDGDKISRICAGDITKFDDAVPLPSDFRGMIGMYRGEFESDWNVKPLSELVALGFVKPPEGYKLEGETFVAMSLIEKYKTGVEPVPQGMIIDGDDIRPMTRAEQVTAGEITQEEADRLDKEDRINANRARLVELDAMAIRPLRAILSGASTDADVKKLADIEAEANAIRSTQEV